MPISVRGTLVVTRKRGRKGEFNIGDLCTEIGEFEVKDALIEEFEPGKYTGEFVIKWIEPDSFSWRGKVFVKVRANVEAIYIDEADETPDAAHTALPPEPDPADPTPPRDERAATVEAVDQGSPSVARRPRAAPADEPAPDDRALFGAELYPLLEQRHAMKLDPTIDRMQFRQQRDRLKALGYTFDVKSQTWSSDVPT